MWARPRMRTSLAPLGFRRCGLPRGTANAGVLSNRLVSRFSPGTTAFIRMAPGAEIGRLAFEILGGSQSRFPYPVAAGVLSIRPMPGGERFQLLDRADCYCSHFSEPHAWLNLHNFDPGASIESPRFARTLCDSRQVRRLTRETWRNPVDPLVDNR